MRLCIRCGAELVQNPLNRHWHHCPNCEPGWVEAIHRFTRLQQLDAFAFSAASDPRGRPTLGGHRA